jgi:hypothetical protein
VPRSGVPERENTNRVQGEHVRARVAQARAAHLTEGNKPAGCTPSAAPGGHTRSLAGLGNHPPRRREGSPRR